MDADDLILFDAIVTEEGLSAAARKLGLPKATVSRRLMRLETDAGAQLFDRIGRKLRLTQAGEALRGPSKAIGIALSEARSLTLAALKPSSGMIRVVSPFLFGKLILSPFLGQFLAERRQVTAVARFDNSTVDPLRENIDIAIRVGAATEPYLIITKLASATMSLYGPAGMASEIKSPADLARFPFIKTCNDHSDVVRLSLSHRGIKHSQTVPVCCTVNDPEAACMVSASGAGVSALPAFLADDFVGRGELVPILPGHVLGHVEIVAVLPPGRQTIPIVADFLRALRRQINQRSRTWQR